MCLPRRDIMRLLNKPGFAVFSCLLCVLLIGQAQPQQNQQNQSVQPTPLPADIDGSDPALPVWMRPAKSASPSKTTPTTSTTSTTANTGKQPPVNEDIVPGTGQVGQVTKEAGGFKIRSVVQNVTLPVTVVDDRR